MHDEPWCLVWSLSTVQHKAEFVPVLLLDWSSLKSALALPAMNVRLLFTINSGLFSKAVQDCTCASGHVK